MRTKTRKKKKLKNQIERERNTKKKTTNECCARDWFIGIVVGIFVDDKEETNE